MLNFLTHRQEVYPQPFQNTCKGFSCCCYLQTTYTTSGSPPPGFKYPVWFLASFSFVPAPTGFGPKYSVRLFSGLCSPSEVFLKKLLCGRRVFGCGAVVPQILRVSFHQRLWFRPAKLLCLCKDRGRLLQDSFLKNPGIPPQVHDVS